MTSFQPLLNLISYVLLYIAILSHAKRFYDHQFSPESSHLQMPPTVVFSSFMGKITYPHMPLLLESMRWNSMVHFKIINIIRKGSNDSYDIVKLANEMNISNVQVVVISIDDWIIRVKDRLNIDIPFTMAWSYKMCDFKPVLAHLFPEFTGPEYKYWGFGDMDLVWGNFSRFAGWFQGQAFVISGDSFVYPLTYNY